MSHFAVHLKLTQYCKLTIFHYKIKIKLKKIINAGGRQREPWTHAEQCQGAGGPKLHQEAIHSPTRGRRCAPRQPVLPLKQAVLQEKMLSLPNHQRNANQNHNEVSPHTRQNGHHQKVYREFPGSQGGRV